jgi:hypothetical protein
MQETPVAAQTEASQPEAAEPASKPEAPFEVPKLADLLDFGDEEEEEDEDEKLPLKPKGKGRRSPIDDLLTYGFPVIWVDPTLIPPPPTPPMPLLPHAGGFGSARPFAPLLSSTQHVTQGSGAGTVLRYPSLPPVTASPSHATGSTSGQSTLAQASPAQPATTVTSAATSKSTTAQAPAASSSTATAAAKNQTAPTSQPPVPQTATTNPLKGKPVKSGLPAPATTPFTKAQQPASTKPAVSPTNKPRTTGSAPRNQSQAVASNGQNGSMPTPAQSKATQRAQARARQAADMHALDLVIDGGMRQLAGDHGMGGHPGLHPNPGQHPAGGQHHGAAPGGVHHNGAHR